MSTVRTDAAVRAVSAEALLRIGGEWREAERGSRFDVEDPATGERIGFGADASPADVDAAVGAASAAFRSWAGATADDRGRILAAAAQLIDEEIETLSRLITLESGKPIRESRSEVRGSARYFAWAAEEAKRTYGRTIPASAPDKRLFTFKQPVGVVAALTPWNFPVSLIARKIAPALAAGCTVVIRPSRHAPNSANALIRLLIQAGIPEGVVNTVTSSAPGIVGYQLATHPLVRHVTFTGSTTVGKQILATAATTLKRVTLELGGQAPLIVFPDADLVAAVDAAAVSKFRNAGQTCIATNRLLVHRDIATEFATALTARVGHMRVGHGLDEATDVGPLISEAALARVSSQISEALEAGAKVIQGGTRIVEPPLDRGNFLEPTILDDVPADTLVLREETFGPVLPIVRFDTESEAVELANSTPYGLAAYVFTRDVGRIFRLVSELDFGVIGANDIAPNAAQLPSGGVKESGLGRENGPEGVEAFMETKAVSLALPS